MAPPAVLFPVSELENRIQVKTVNLKEKRRKGFSDVDLEKCELFELVQYSSSTAKQAMEKAVESGTGVMRREFTPFVRLFRRCGEGSNMFHVETTAWEGEHAYERAVKQERQVTVQQLPAEQSALKSQDAFARYGSHFRSI